ncbi:DUF6368 family protein [Streptomyces sp. NPDC005799]|uniref:DUF6368 family protein n=1 Tax=Streptomyces sp. NPDC005799 TaxID=3154678 RepID=UPI0033C407AA
MTADQQAPGHGVTGIALRLVGMAGPSVGIELQHTVPASALHQLRLFLVSVSDWFEERRPGSFDLGVVAERLGIVDSNRDGSRPFAVVVSGPGFGDEEMFDAEHGDMDLRPFIGFAPTHDVGVIAMSNGQVDHVVTALLAAEVMDIVGGVAGVETRREQVAVVGGLPGAIAQMADPSPVTFGSSELLRRWAAHPGFRLLK